VPDNNELVNMLRSVIHEELKPVHQELQGLRQGQQALEKGQQALVNRQQALEMGQQELKQGQGRLESKIDKLELRMENEVIEKIHALFDAREVTNDNFVKIMEKLDSIEIDTGYLVSRVSRLEKMVK